VAGAEDLLESHVQATSVQELFNEELALYEAEQARRRS